MVRLHISKSPRSKPGRITATVTVVQAAKEAGGPRPSINRSHEPQTAIQKSELCGTSFHHIAEEVLKVRPFGVINLGPDICRWNVAASIPGTSSPGE